MALLKPDYRFRAVEEITPEFLQQEGISGLLVDIDNTIVQWRGEEPSQKVLDWFSKIKHSGVVAALVSNAGGPRARRMSETLGLPVVAPARKPFRTGYDKGRELLNLRVEVAAVVGDQVFMDVLGGERAGLRTILVEPIANREFPLTRVVRLLERLVRKPL
jgi:hypothetical protein